MKKEKILIFLGLLPLLTFCTTDHNNSKKEPAKIEHITRKGISQGYKSKDIESRPYIDTQADEPLFSEQEFATQAPMIEGAPCLKDKIELQEDIDQLAKLKRAGRLSQKDYNARVTAIHAKNKAHTTDTSVLPAPPTPTAEPNKQTSPTSENMAPKKELKRIEAIHIDPDDEIFHEE